MIVFLIDIFSVHSTCINDLSNTFGTKTGLGEYAVQNGGADILFTYKDFAKFCVLGTEFFI